MGLALMFGPIRKTPDSASNKIKSSPGFDNLTHVHVPDQQETEREEQYKFWYLRKSDLIYFDPEIQRKKIGVSSDI
jgi:hypothetical protein